MNYYVIEHPESLRRKAIFDNKKFIKSLPFSSPKIPSCKNLNIIYYDWTDNNCPYVFSKHFLATFCKVNSARQSIRIQPDDYFFYVTSYTKKTANRLYFCDLVFKVYDYWKWSNNNIWNGNDKTFLYKIKNQHFSHNLAQRNHLARVVPNHVYRRKRIRYTYISNPNNSFQYQKNNFLIDISQMLTPHRPNHTSTPFSYSPPLYQIPQDIGQKIIFYLQINSNTRLNGNDFLNYIEPKNRILY